MMLRDLSFRDVVEFFEECLNPLHHDDPKRVTARSICAGARASGDVLSHLGWMISRPLLRRRCDLYRRRLEAYERTDLPMEARRLVRRLQGILDGVPALLEGSSEDEQQNVRCYREAARALRRVPALLSHLDDIVLRHDLLST